MSDNNNEQFPSLNLIKSRLRTLQEPTKEPAVPLLSGFKINCCPVIFDIVEIPETDTGFISVQYKGELHRVCLTSGLRQSLLKVSSRYNFTSTEQFKGLRVEMFKDPNKAVRGIQWSIYKV